MLWAISLAIGAALTVITYGLRGPRLVMLLRLVAGTFAAALLLDVPLAPARPLAASYALDVSASWDSTAWALARAMVDTAAPAAPDSLELIGDSLRVGRAPERPSDLRTLVGPLVERARSLGRPVVLVTDGRLEDAERLAELPLGSRVFVPVESAVADMAIAGFDPPRAAVIGDTLDWRVQLRAGSAGAAARTLTLTLGGRPLATTAVEALDAYAEREIALRAVVPALEGEQGLIVALDSGDTRPMNDTARAPLLVTGVASVALISTSPDQDARFALTVLRGTQRGAVRAYWRVAPGAWREGDALRPVTEEQVRRALTQASLVVLHGDTAYFGAPLLRARGALVLMTPPSDRSEFYVTAAGDSPLAAAFADLPFDALPPLQVGEPVRGGGLSALMAKRSRRTDERAVVVLRDGSPRSVVVPASGFWRWRSRGGRPADAFEAVWGTIFDWVTTSARSPGATAAAPRIAMELVPSPPRVQGGEVGTGPVRDLAPRSRGAWWLAALALLALCGEWVMRRRIGWR